MVITLPFHFSRLKLTENNSILSIFRRLGPFPQVFRRVEGWSMLELHKIIRLSDVVAFPIACSCFMGEFAREECSKLSKMIFF